MAESRTFSEDPLKLGNSMGVFSLDIHNALAKDSPSENLFISPFSIMTALGMTLLGCKANTHQQLSEVLKINHNNDQVKKAFNEVIQKYKVAAQDYELKTANMMYVSNKLSVRPEFSDSLTSAFHSVAKEVDFSSQAAAVTSEINQAVEKETNSRIKDLIPQGSLNSLTRMVLVNAVYFKGLWKKQFKKQHTRDRKFWLDEDTSIDVPMMFVKTSCQFKFLREIRASMLALNYKGSNLSMVIILPDSKTGLAKVEESLSSVNLTDILATQQESSDVDVYLPKFKLEYEQDLASTLSKLGAGDLFTAGVSDLSGIGSVPGDLYVSNVFHKAFVEVTEEGTEAAAATGVVMMTRAMVRGPPPFAADRPFMFIIYDRELSLPLFTGRLTKPEPSKAKMEL